MWPLLHNAIEKPRFERSWWHAYQEVNRIFADRAMAAADEYPDAITWVHDYHLMLVPQLIRNRRPERRSGSSCTCRGRRRTSTPGCPGGSRSCGACSARTWSRFHTDEYRYNFLRSCARQLGDSGVEVRGSSVVLPDGRAVTTATAPISIDAGEFAALAADPEVKEGIEALEEQFSGRTLLLGVDRLDYTKGIIERLLAVEMLLERNPELRTSLAFLQLAVPSRDDVREYRQLRGTVEQHVGRINGLFTQPGSDVPVHYLYRGLSPQQLAAYYAAADALLVTPLIDGMNLVCKEYVTVQQAARRQRRPDTQRVHRRRRRAVAGRAVQPVRRGGAVLPDRAGARAASRTPGARPWRPWPSRSARTTSTTGCPGQLDADRRPRRGRRARQSAAARRRRRSRHDGRSRSAPLAGSAGPGGTSPFRPACDSGRPGRVVELDAARRFAMNGGQHRGARPAPTGESCLSVALAQHGRRTARAVGQGERCLATRPAARPQPGGRCAACWTPSRGLGDQLGLSRDSLLVTATAMAADPSRLDLVLAHVPRPMSASRWSRAYASWWTGEVRDVLTEPRRGAVLGRQGRNRRRPAVAHRGLGLSALPRGRTPTRGRVTPRAAPTGLDAAIARPTPGPAAAPVYAYFNNDQSGAAVLDAETFTRLTDRH